jgi:hypothetical protein
MQTSSDPFLRKVSGNLFWQNYHFLAQSCEHSYYSQHWLFSVVIFYKVSMNVAFVNTKSLLPAKTESRSLKDSGHDILSALYD